MPAVEVPPTKGTVINMSADGAVMVAVWWNAEGRNRALDRPSDLFTVDGDRMDWQTITLTRSDVGRIVKTVMDNISHNPANGPITIIEAPSD